MRDSRPTYQGIPNVSPASLQRAGLTLMVVPEAVGSKAPSLPDKGWAKTLGLRPGEKIDDVTIQAILAYLEKQVRKPTSEGGADPTPGVFNPIFEQTVRDWRAATQKDLTERWKGKTIGTLPASPLSWGPNVKQGDIFKPGTLLGDSPLGGIGNILGIITDADFILGILGVMVGTGLVLLAYPHVLGSVA